MASRKQKTPEERSEVLEAAHRKARKTYKTDLKKKRSDVSPEELEVIKMQLTALKVVGGYSNSQCAAIVGLSRGQVREIVQDEKFQKQINTVKESLPKAAIALGQAYLVEGVQAVVHVLRTETDNALVLKAAAELFDRFGIPKTTKSEVKTEAPVSSGAGEISETFMEKLRKAPIEVQEQIASLHESFSEGVERILSGGTTDGT